MNQTECKADMV